MTTPVMPMSVPVPTPAGQAVSGQSRDSGDSSGQSGQNSPEGFAAMVAGLVSALLGADPGGAPGAAADGSDTQPASTSDAAVAAAVPASPDAVAAAVAALVSTPRLANLGRASDLSGAPDGAESRPKMASVGAAAPDSGASVAPAGTGPLPESGAGTGPGFGDAAPSAQPVRTDVAAAPAQSPASDAPELANLGRVSAPSEAPDRAKPHPKLEVGTPSAADTAPTAAPAATPGVAPVTAPAGPAATAPAGAPAAPPAPAATAAQLVEPVVAVHRRGPDGTHTMTVDITPDELGPVRVHVELRDGNVELRLAGHSEAAREALRAALPELRRALEAAGVGTGSFDVTPDGSSAQDRSQPQFGGNTAEHRGNPQNGHARPAWAGVDGRAPQQPEAAAVQTAAGSLDLRI